ncbi:protocatechuate 3,4-dioxygenase [Sphingobium estronivorans]|uniref:DODA-type extradiol aromatic ring-opening family dioxygenase n=1 Tax=Sphingobium estronivorans TaxID=1577690 RepID=UPI00123C3A10|nr:protocatechuate 3,4-dioxygenase [Sphingobium estronivorans]
MGKIVGGFATSHVLFSRAGHEVQADAVFAGMEEIGRRIDALSPDIVVIVSNDHMINFNTQFQAPFVVGIGASYTAFGDLGIPNDYSIPGEADFAQGFVDHASACDYDMGVVRAVRFDHGMAIPALFASPQGVRPVVPLYTNVDMRPVPSAKRCYRLGQVLADYIEKHRPADERVVVLGAGGMSHWVGVERQGDVNEEFDRWLLERFEAGDADALTGLSIQDIEARSGNGGVELINWIIMLGALGGAKAKTLYYEPMESWWTGMGGIAIEA